MTVTDIGRQISAGVIVGLSAAIYAISYGALMFSGPLSALVGFGVSVALIAAMGGALFGLMSEERTFISGPDSNTISILASMLAVIGTLGLSETRALNLALETIFLTSIVCAATFYAVARLNLAGLIRYIPFSVMAGFLASTGWLMSSGALNIISGTPLTWLGLQRLALDPFRPDLAYGIVVAAALQALAPRVSAAVLIPAVMVIASLPINLLVQTGVCDLSQCAAEIWLFGRLPQTQWLAPWNLAWSPPDLIFLLESLPAMLVVAFVGLLTILLSVASLELNFRREFDLNRVLNAHAANAAAVSGFGGFMGLISIARTTINRHAGGGPLSGIAAAGLCLALLLGAGDVMAYVPKAAVGGLVLYLGINMMKQWLWDQRRVVSRAELAQIGLILALVANYGFLVGFSVGIVISCVIFVINYSRIPLTSLASDLSLFASSVVRPQHEAEVLKLHGAAVVLYRLNGYVFFGSASKLDRLFHALAIDKIEGVIVDFTKVSGIDQSAIGVLQRILRRYQTRPIRFYFVCNGKVEAALRGLSAAIPIDYVASMDKAVEMAEERLIERHESEVPDATSFEFLADIEDREIFRGYCELREVQPGDIVCTEGELSDEIFFLERGNLDIVKATVNDGSVRLAKLHKGWVAGEVAFYTGEPRTAAIVATAASALYVLSRDGLQRMRAERPGLATQFDHMVIRKISYSLARTNRLIASLSD